MADLALGVVKDIVKTGMVIKEALEMVRHNKEECQDLQVLVATTITILSRLHDMELTSHPAMCGALIGLNGSLDRALKLVIKCQKRSAMRRFLTAGDMAKQLRRVHDDIQKKMQLGNLAITASIMELTVEFTGTTIVQYDGFRPLPCTETQCAAEMETIYNSNSSTGDARSEKDGAEIITMLTTGTETLIALSSNNIAASGLTEFSLSEDKISGVRKHTNVVNETKFVIKVVLSCERCYSKTRRQVPLAGVSSLEFDHRRNQVVVVGDCLDFDRSTSSEFWAIAARISRFMWPLSRSSASRPSPILVELEDTDGPELAAATVPTPSSNLSSNAATSPADSTLPSRKFVIGVDLSCKRCYSKTRRLDALAGVISLEFDHMKNHVVVVAGDRLDFDELTSALRSRNCGFRDITARISRFMWSRARSSASRPPQPSPRIVKIEDTDAPELAAATTGQSPRSRLVTSTATPPADHLEAPAMANDDLFFTTTPTDALLLQHQPAAARAPLRGRKHTFNMSRVYRSVRLRRHSRMMPLTQPSPSERSGACVLQLLVSCALCTLLLLLASVWDLH